MVHTAGTMHPATAAALLKEKQKYVYAVFVKTLRTDVGKEYTQENAMTHDAQHSRALNCSHNYSCVSSYLGYIKIWETHELPLVTKPLCCASPQGHYYSSTDGVLEETMMCISPISLQQQFERQELEPMMHHSQHARATKVGSTMKAKALSLFLLFMIHCKQHWKETSLSLQPFTTLPIHPLW